MTRLAMLIVLLWLLNPASAVAECGGGGKTIFRCKTVNAKRIEVCDAGKTLVYAFGKPKAKPEIVLRVAKDRASTTQWQGFGRYMAYSVEIPNGKTLYSVYWGVDKLLEGDDKPPAIEAGVTVTVNRQTVATIRCDDDGSIVQEIEGIPLKPTEQPQ